MKTNFSNVYQQQGAVLLMSLVMLIVLTLLGISALDATKLETKMAANNQSEHTAFQSANAGIDGTYSYYKSNENEIPDDFETVIKEKVGTKFGNNAENALQLRKVSPVGNEISFYIIESIGCTNAKTSNPTDIKDCDGKKITLREGWVIKTAEADQNVSDETAVCYNSLIPECQAPMFSAVSAECNYESVSTDCAAFSDSFTSQLGCGINSTPNFADDGKSLPTYCPDIFAALGL